LSNAALIELALLLLLTPGENTLLQNTKPIGLIPGFKPPST
jgi:hypothetical protein